MSPGAPFDSGWTRAQLLLFQRQTAVAAAVNALRWGDLRTEWQGDDGAGRFRHSNGQGDDVATVWDRERLVSVLFAHESERSAAARDEAGEAAAGPRAHLGALPASFDDLLDRAAELLERGGQNVTAGLWAEGERVLLAEPAEEAYEHGLWLIEPPESPRELQQWLTRHRSLTEPLARLVIRAAEASAKGEVALTAEEKAALEGPGWRATDRGRSGAEALLRAVGVRP